MRDQKKRMEKIKNEFTLKSLRREPVASHSL